MFSKRTAWIGRGFIGLCLLGLTACGGELPGKVVSTMSFYADDEITVEITAPNFIANEKLAITLRLRNRSKRMIGLSASTPCSVFRWSVVDAQSQTIESEPNELCAQVVASDVLYPEQQIEQFYQVPLAAKRYHAGKSYRLLFSFWGYAGHHNFMVKQPD